MADRKLKIIVDMGGDALSGIGSLAKGIAGLGVAAAAAGIAALGAGLVYSVGQAREAAAGQKELAATIAATGGVAGITVDSANELAGALAQVTNFTDDAVLGAENILLTFTEIGNDVFPRVTETALDMAAKGFGTPTAAATMLGKALNDPIDGLTALSRVGVSFTDQQAEMIKRMAETGDMVGAQTAILDAIAQQGFGGVARAMADPIVQLGNTFGEAFETVGARILPTINDLAARAIPLVGVAMDNLSDSRGVIVGISAAIGSLTDDFLGLVGIDTGMTFVTTFQNIGLAIQTTVNAIGLFVSSVQEGHGVITSLAASLLTLGVSTETVTRLSGILLQFSTDLSANLVPAGLMIEDAWNRIAAVFGAATGNITGTDLAFMALQGTLDAVVIGVQAVAIGAQGIAFVFESVNTAVRTAIGLFNQIQTIYGALSPTLQGAISGVGGGLVNTFTGAGIVQNAGAAATLANAPGVAAAGIAGGNMTDPQITGLLGQVVSAVTGLGAAFTSQPPAQTTVTLDGNTIASAVTERVGGQLRGQFAVGGAARGL